MLVFVLGLGYVIVTELVLAQWALRADLDRLCQAITAVKDTPPAELPKALEDSVGEAVDDLRSNETRKVAVAIAAVDLTKTATIVANAGWKAHPRVSIEYRCEAAEEISRAAQARR